jgi:hypothetical protein
MTTEAEPETEAKAIAPAHGSDTTAVDVFTSYSRTDQAAVRRLSDELQDEGRRAWIDWGSIHPSAEWAAEIELGIRAADAFVFVISPDAVVSQICLQELATASQPNKRLIPVVFRDTAHQDAPPQISKRQWIFMREQDDWGAAVDALLQALDVDVDWLRRHNALLGQALAWSDAGNETSRLLTGNSLRQAEGWLTEGAGKDPSPAPVHLAFVQASRRRATSLLRRVLALTIVGLAVAIALMAWALYASYAAQLAREEAVARELGAAAGLAGSERDELIERSALLAIESSYIHPSRQNDIPLRRALSGR